MTPLLMSRMKLRMNSILELKKMKARYVYHEPKMLAHIRGCVRLVRVDIVLRFPRAVIIGDIDYFYCVKRICEENKFL